jgi:S-adenosylmethionine:tRNA ribosyltransferase-isomerase
MRTDQLDYTLPEELIAQSPANPRDSSKLLLCPRKSGPFTTRIFHELPELLNPGDIIVTNAAKVMPARLFGYKHPSGAKIEVLLLEKLAGDDPSRPRFKALLKRKRRLEPGDRMLFPESALVADVIEGADEVGEDVIELSVIGGVSGVEDEIERIGRIPLPPYITDYDGDMNRYQTIYASVPGSVAAPTAGLHFTKRVLDGLKRRGIERAEVHLRVGWGTFSPIRAENLEDHHLHAESGQLTRRAADQINACRKNGGRIVAVGTTVTRLLETVTDNDGIVHAFEGATDLYITPGYGFRAVDVLLTNFHLPKTSLLALVAAFMGVERTLEAYRYAVKERFRFYSFGDAMLVV